jgi:SpoVK/Ycf46/Vps4 family AAA+-type ATPase
VSRALSLCKENNTVLMFDEVEDVFYNTPYQNRPNVSKVEINRFFENNPQPIIWICNDIGYLDRAYLRRFSYIAQIERPDRTINKSILAQNLKKYHIKYQNSDLEYIISKYKFTPAILENAAKVTNLMKGSISDMRIQLEAVEKAMHGKSEQLGKFGDFSAFNMDLLNTDLDLKKFNEQIKGLDKLNFSLCLYGASGTGKTAYANYLTQLLGLEVLTKRASDLIGTYVGETEQNIAKAFNEAKKNKSVLIFDEGDSFLRDRTQAVRSWEITQVNEMLTQMENHPYPFICTTNLMTNIDQASLRRFTFKIKYEYMTDEQIIKAFKHFFGIELKENIMLKLSAGDFNVVKKKAEIMGISGDKDKLIEMLQNEQECSEPQQRKIGFI